MVTHVEALYVLQIFTTTFAFYRPSNLIKMFTLPHIPHIPTSTSCMRMQMHAYKVGFL